MTSGASGYLAMVVVGTSNTINGNYIYNSAGGALNMNTAYYNTLTNSTIVANTSSFFAFYIQSSTANILSSNFILNQSGDAMQFLSYLMMMP
jgi:hypothetical protein